ncbi:HMG-box [Lichtheimia hyalospora FSU 10163]|nr:HMG-box [Lichtheimia hyalospora FSU 10163]
MTTSQKRKLLETYRALADNYTTLANLLEETTPGLSATSTSPRSSSRAKPKRKKAKVERNSNKPKRPSSAYIFFTQAQTEAVREELGENCSMREVVKALAKRWKRLTDKQKEPYNRMARESSDQYMRELEYSQQIDEEDEIDELANDDSSQYDTQATVTIATENNKGEKRPMNSSKKDNNTVEETSDEESTDLSDLSD